MGVKTKSHDVYINTPYGRINKTTGKLENAMPQDKSVGGNIGSVFGEEFDPKNKENIDGEIGKNKDKTKALISMPSLSRCFHRKIRTAPQLLVVVTCAS